MAVAKVVAAVVGGMREAARATEEWVESEAELEEAAAHWEGVADWLEGAAVAPKEGGAAAAV